MGLPVAIRCGLISIGRALIGLRVTLLGVGCRLVGVGCRLVGVGCRLVGVGRRLVGIAVKSHPGPPGYHWHLTLVTGLIAFHRSRPPIRSCRPSPSGRAARTDAWSRTFQNHSVIPALSIP
jgi:hypothetical protein